MKYETRNLKELPKFRDGLSYLYLEHGRIEQQDQAVAYYTQEGVVAIPAAALGVLMLGPGTTITHAAIVSAGYSPALGFIHTGKQLSFVYDVADVYKAETLVPVAFKVVAESEVGVERRVRHALREQLREVRLLERIVYDLRSLFDALEVPDPYAADPAAPGELWDPDGPVPGGMAYGSDRLGEGAQDPEG
jgi:hypothetical protein